MLSELHLKFHSETGTYATTKKLFDEDEHPVDVVSDEYLEWLEALAMKQIKKEEPLYAEIKKLRKQLHEACDRLNQHGLL